MIRRRARLQVGRREEERDKDIILSSRKLLFLFSSSIPQSICLGQYVLQRQGKVWKVVYPQRAVFMHGNTPHGVNPGRDASLKGTCMTHPAG